MIKDLRNLTPEQTDLMLKAPVLVCILIAGADGDIDRKEIQKAFTISARKKESQNMLSEYFGEVFNDFEDKIKILIQSYPFESTQREPLIIHELAQVNAILPKLHPKFATAFYNLLLELAREIASSSGGWLGMNSVGQEEAKYLRLPMIQDPQKINF